MAPALAPSERRAALSELAAAVRAHLAAEEAVVCPALADALGDAAAGRALRLDESLRLLLSDLAALEAARAGAGHANDGDGDAKDGDDAEEGEAVARVMRVFAEHMASGEHALPALRAAVGDGGLMELGCRFRDARAAAAVGEGPAAARA